MRYSVRVREREMKQVVRTRIPDGEERVEDLVDEDQEEHRSAILRGAINTAARSTGYNCCIACQRVAHDGGDEYNIPARRSGRFRGVGTSGRRSPRKRPLA